MRGRLQISSGTFLLVVLTVVACALRAAGLVPQQLTGDDAEVAVSAVNYVHTGHLGPTMWNHPHLRDLLTYVSLALIGGTIGLKLPSLVLGTLTVPLTGAVAARLSKRMSVGVLAAFCLAIDSVHIDFSRQAVHEVHMAFFALAGIFFVLRHLDTRGLTPLILAGVSFGLGCASKWYVVFPLVTTIGWVMYRVAGDTRLAPASRRGRLLFVVASLAVLPLLVYLLTFVPWFLRGYGIGDWLALQQAMFLETYSHVGYMPYTLELSHQPNRWFLIPASFADLAGAGQVLLAITNPLTWLLTLPAIAYCSWAGWRGRNDRMLYLCALFLMAYIPLAAASRPIWLHTAFAVLPFAFTAAAWFLIDLAGDSRRGKTFLVAYAVVTVAVAVPLYLLATGRGPLIRALVPVIEMFRPPHERMSNRPPPVVLPNP